MSETIRMPDPGEDKGNVDVTSKPPSSGKPPTSSSKPPSSNPTGVEQTIKSDSSQQPKSDSRTQGGSLKKGGASSKSRLDDIPSEAAPFVDDPTKQLGSYVLVKQIGKGGMGAVWKAWDKKLTRRVAIQFLLDPQDQDVLRFQREAKLAARLRHPNIAPLYEVGEQQATQA